MPPHDRHLEHAYRLGNSFNFNFLTYLPLALPRGALFGRLFSVPRAKGQGMKGEA